MALINLETLIGRIMKIDGDDKRIVGIVDGNGEPWYGGDDLPENGFSFLITDVPDIKMAVPTDAPAGDETLTPLLGADSIEA